jgi:hypothetical protein
MEIVHGADDHCITVSGTVITQQENCRHTSTGVAVLVGF